MSADELLAFDREHIWHPYSPMPATTPVHPVVSAEGVRLRLADGRELVDGMAAWWAAIHGYRHPRLDAAVTGQLRDMAHVMFGGLTHPVAVRLARLLVSLTPARSRWTWRSRWRCSTSARAAGPPRAGC